MIAIIFAAIALSGVFVTVERMRPHPMLDLRLFCQPRRKAR